MKTNPSAVSVALFGLAFTAPSLVAAQLKDEFVMFGPPDTNVAYDWGGGKKFCEDKGMELATHAQWCSDGVPLGGRKDWWSSWAPINDYENGWVQVGKWGTLCTTWKEITGTDAAWGRNGIKDNDSEAHYILCVKKKAAITFEDPITANPPPRYIVVRCNNGGKTTCSGGVVLDTENLAAAKAKLNSLGGSRLIAEYKNCVLSRDPHRINGIIQSATNGFHKFWWDWNDINRMIDSVQTHINKGNQMKCPLQLFGPPNIIGARWEDAGKFCKAKAMRLASRAEWCAGGSPFGGKKSDDQWVAIADFPNGWIQIGAHGAAAPCKTHRETHVTRAPTWGLDGVKQPWENNYVLCAELPTPKPTPAPTPQPTTPQPTPSPTPAPTPVQLSPDGRPLKEFDGIIQSGNGCLSVKGFQNWDVVGVAPCAYNKHTIFTFKTNGQIVIKAGRVPSGKDLCLDGHGPANEIYLMECGSYTYHVWNIVGGRMQTKSKVDEAYCLLYREAADKGKGAFDTKLCNDKDALSYMSHHTTSYRPIETMPDEIWEERLQETVDFWGPIAMKKAKPLEMLSFLDPFREPSHRELESVFDDYETNNTELGIEYLKTFYEQHDPWDPRGKSEIPNSRWVEDSFYINGGGKMAQATGRILFTFGEKFASCSGTAVRDYASPDRSLIVTAAHCLYEDRTKTWAKHVLFIPNQDDGGDGISDRNCYNNPFGCWIPEFSVVDSKWANGVNDVKHDFAFLVVRNKGAHVGYGGRDLALEDVVQTVDIDWTNKAQLTAERKVYSMGLPGVWSNQLRYAKGSLKFKNDLQFVEGCSLTEGSSGGPMPVDPFDDNPRLFSVNSFKSGYFEGGEFIQTSCGGPILSGNSFCALLTMAEETVLGSAVDEGGVIRPYENNGCRMPGWCHSDEECTDGLFCNGVEKCDSDLNQCIPGSDPCDGGRCDEEKGCLPPCTSDADCDNGVFCDGAETCVSGQCVASSVFPCQSGQQCDPFLDSCTQAECFSDSDCDDGIFCNGQELCIQGTCQANGDPCAANEECHELSRSCPLKICNLVEVVAPVT